MLTLLGEEEMAAGGGDRGVDDHGLGEEGGGLEGWRRQRQR